MKISVLLIPSQDYLRHPHPTRLHYIFENFDDAACVTVLNVRVRKGPARIRSKHEVIEVGSASANLLQSYLMSYASFHVELARLLKRQKYDCIVLSHIISPLIPLLARRKCLVFDYKDVYSRSASAPFRAPMRWIVYWIARLFEELLFRSRMAVVVPTPSMQALVRQRYGSDAVLITNGANMELFRPLSIRERRAARTKLGLRENDFCLCYLGSIEKWLDLESVVLAIASIQQTRLVLIGGPVRSRAYMDQILHLCDKLQLKSRVIATGFRAQADAARIVSACDAAIVPFRTDMELSLVALPDKLFEYLGVGIPVISTRLPDVENMFGDLVHFYRGSSDLAEIIRDLLSRDVPWDHVAREDLVAKYDWRHISRRYQEFLARLIVSN